MKITKLSPSVLSADFMKLGEEVRILEENGIEYLHLDVMDGIFVPNISVGMPVIKSLRKYTNMVIDAHFMIDKPERYIDEFINLGCDIINFHFEATSKHIEIIEKVKKANKKVGMTIKPNTDYKELLPFIKDLDLVLVMGVEPGFGGQSLIKDCVQKVHKLRQYIDENKLICELQLDGGVKLSNVRDVIEAGASLIVVGSDIFEKASSIEKGNIIKEYNSIFEEYLNN